MTIGLLVLPLLMIGVSSIGMYLRLPTPSSLTEINTFLSYMNTVCMIFKTPPLKYFVHGVSDIMLAVGQFGGYAVVRLCGCFIAQPYNLITVHFTTA
jgi:hypothetical protein